MFQPFVFVFLGGEVGVGWWMGVGCRVSPCVSCVCVCPVCVPCVSAAAQEAADLGTHALLNDATIPIPPLMTQPCPYQIEMFFQGASAKI